MNEYTRGALEALTWAILVAENSDSAEKILSELKKVRESILKGVAVDFGEKIKFFY